MEYRADIAPYHSSEYGGRGIFATTSIETGAKIMEEQPLLSCNMDYDEYDVQTWFPVIKLYKEYQKWTPEDRAKFINLPYSASSGPGSAGSFLTPLVRQIELWREHTDRDPHVDIQTASVVAAIFHKNSFKDKNEPGLRRLFLDHQLFNHSCTPNAWSVYDPLTGTQVVHALRRINGNEEIAISYIDPIVPRDQRWAALGFQCRCMVCDDEDDSSIDHEKHCRRLAELKAQIRNEELRFSNDHNSERLLSLIYEWIDIASMAELSVPDLHKLAKVYRDRGEMDKACETQDDAVSALAHAYGTEHPKVQEMRELYVEYRQLQG